MAACRRAACVVCALHCTQHTRCCVNYVDFKMHDATIKIINARTQFIHKVYFKEDQAVWTQQKRQSLWANIVGYKISSVSLATFVATEFHKMFWGREPRQGVKLLQSSRDLLRPSLQGVADALAKPKLIAHNSNTLKMRTESENVGEPSLLDAGVCSRTFYWKYPVVHQSVEWHQKGRENAVTPFCATSSFFLPLRDTPAGARSHSSGQIRSCSEITSLLSERDFVRHTMLRARKKPDEPLMLWLASEFHLHWPLHSQRN